MLRMEPLDALLSTRGRYEDGIYSLLLEDLQAYESLFSKVDKVKNM